MPEPAIRFYDYVERKVCSACGKTYAEDIKVPVGQRPPAARPYWCDKRTCQTAKDATPEARNERLCSMLRDLPTLLRMLKKGQLAGQLDDLFLAIQEGNPVAQYFPKEMIAAANALPKPRRAFLAIKARRAAPTPPADAGDTTGAMPELSSTSERLVART